MLFPRLLSVVTMLGLLLAKPVLSQDFISVRKTEDGWSLMRGGTPFFSMGINVVLPVDWPPKDREDRGHYDGVAAHGGSMDVWAKHTEKQLQSMGFNTLGGWCSDEMIQRSRLCFTKVLSFGWSGNVEGDRLRDVWSDAYAAAVHEAASKEVAPLANEPRLLGYFTNNELNWHGEHGWPTDPGDSHLDRYLRLPVAAKGRQHLLTWLRARFVDYARFAEVFESPASNWDEFAAVTSVKARRFLKARETRYAWAGEVAERYFALCEEAIRRHDKNHLILGCRLAGSGILSVIEAQARHCDVISINRYEKSGNPALDTLDRIFALTGKPMLMTEYGWRAMENRSGLTNSHGVDVTVPTQRDRAERLERFIRGTMDRPYMLGMHWFQYHDQPTNGRFDGEDSNYGIVDQKDQLYTEVAEALARVQGEMKPDMKRGKVDPAAPKGWVETQGLALQPGMLDLGVNLLPAADRPGMVGTDCDSAHGASLSATPRDKAWVFAFSNGSGWGTSPGFHIPKGMPLAGARKLHLKIAVPKGLAWRVLITETSAFNPGAATDGSDGEAFTTESLRGTGEMQDLMLWLEDCQPRFEWGNQKGGRRMDLNALAQISFALMDAGRQGELRVEAVELVP